MNAERPLRDVVDAAIVGAGVIGLACAFELARRGRSVAVFERDLPGQHASTAAAGLLGTAALPLGEQDDIFPLKLDSLRRYAAFVADVQSASGMSAGYRADGTLWLARGADEDALLDQLHAERVEHGLDSRRISTQAARTMEPNLAAGLVSGLLVDDDVQVDPRQLIPALARAAEQSGARIVSGQAVSGGDYDASAGEWTLRCGSALLARARQVVVTAGPWCDQIAGGGREPLAASGVGPVKGQLLRLSGPPLIDRCIRTTNIDIAQRLNGELVVASTKEPDAGWDLTPTDDARRTLLARATAVLPGLRDAALDEHSVGLRPALADHLPIIGPAGRPGLWLASGHYRHGILLAPATAHWLAEAMNYGSVDPIIAPYGFDRLEQPPHGAEDSLEAAS